MNTLVHGKHKHSELCITIKMSGRTQKFEIVFANERSGFAFFSKDLGHFFAGYVVNGFGVTLREKEPQKQELVNEIDRRQSLIISTDLVEYTIVGNRYILSLRCVSLIAKLNAGSILTAVEYLNYETFSDLQFKQLLRNCFFSFHIDIRFTSGEESLWIYEDHSICFYFLKRPSTLFSSERDDTSGCFKTS